MLMKGVKKCGLLSAFFIIFGLSLVVSSDTNALKHQYLSIPLYNPPRPEIQLNSSTGKYELTGRVIGSGSNSNFETFSIPFSVYYTSDNISQSLKDSDVFKDNFSNKLKFFNSYTSGSQCAYFPSYGGTFQPIFGIDNFSNYSSIGVPDSFKRIPTSSYISDYGYQAYGNNFDFQCMRLHSFGSEGVPSFDLNSFSADFASQYSNNLSPYSYGADGFYSVSTTVKEGIHYSENFNFAKIFGGNNYLNKFSSLTIPLFDEQQSIEYTTGREIEYAGSFTFEKPFNISQTAQDSGHFYISFRGIADDGSNNVYKEIPCTLNQRSVEALNLYSLEYSCPFTVDKNYLYTVQAFHIDAIPDNSSSDPTSWGYVWDTAGSWVWSGQSGAGQYIITDGDDTPGAPINSTRTGKYIPNDASRTFNPSTNDIIVDGQNFSSSLIQLFGFSFLNPFAPLLQMFSDNNQCAQIPTLAGMIHSESTEVCPWFDSSIRNITTPVLSISSMMLVFGFAVRWLGSRSGNFIEDSESHESGGISVGKRGRK